MVTARDKYPQSEMVGFVIILLMGLALVGIGWHEYRTNRMLAERGVVTTATIVSFEGRWNSRKHWGYNHWIEYDGNRAYVSLPMRYQAGQNVRVVYDRLQPSTMRVLRKKGSHLQLHWSSSSSLQFDQSSSIIFMVIGMFLIVVIVMGLFRL